MHLISTSHGLPIGYSMTGAKAGKRSALLSMPNAAPVSVPVGQLITADKGYNECLVRGKVQ